MPMINLPSYHKSWVVEYYNMKLHQWEKDEPSKIRFISHYCWKHGEPTFSSILDELDKLEEQFGFDEMIRRIEEWQIN